MLYTYTRRRDLPALECFVGSADPEKGLFLMEGGPNCRRGLAVDQFGMQLTKLSKKLILLESFFIASLEGKIEANLSEL